MGSTIVITIISWAILIASKLAFIWGPVLAMYVGFEMWHHFITDRFILGMQWTVFEIEVPRDIEKTPMAMELILTNAMYQASMKGLWEIWIKGAPHFWFSLEIAGIDGGVHFYIRTPSRIANLVETQIGMCGVVNSFLKNMMQYQYVHTRIMVSTSQATKNNKKLTHLPRLLNFSDH